MFKVLIAEDDRELLQLFEHVLVKNGYSVKGVGNGQEALDALDAGYYDIIISDIMMPVMDGYALVHELWESGIHIPVLMITAKDAFDDMRLGFASGTDDYKLNVLNGAGAWRINILLDQPVSISCAVRESSAPRCARVPCPAD